MCTSVSGSTCSYKRESEGVGNCMCHSMISTSERNRIAKQAKGKRNGENEISCRRAQPSRLSRYSESQINTGDRRKGDKVHIDLATITEYLPPVTAGVQQSVPVFISLYSSAIMVYLGCRESSSCKGRNAMRDIVWVMYFWTE